MNEVPEHLTAEEKEGWARSLPGAPPAPTAVPAGMPRPDQTLHLERSPLEAPPDGGGLGPPARQDPPAKLGRPQNDVVAADSDSGAARVASLTVSSGPDTGATFPLETSPVYIGRAPDNDIVINDPATSRRHARFEQRGRELLVVDLGSANGTLVDGVRVVEQVLASGSVITMGQNRFVVSIAESSTR